MRACSAVVRACVLSCALSCVPCCRAVVRAVMCAVQCCRACVLWPRYTTWTQEFFKVLSGPNFFEKVTCRNDQNFHRRTRLLAPRRNPTHGVLRHRACRNSAIACHAMAIRVAGFMLHAPPGPAQHMLATSMHVPCASPGHRATIRLTCGQLLVL